MDLLGFCRTGAQRPQAPRRCADGRKAIGKSRAVAAGPSDSVRARSCKTNVSDSKSAMDSAFAARQRLCFQGLIIPLIQPIDLIFQTIFNARQKNNELDHPLENL
jgi:hypothetical protein